MMFVLFISFIFVLILSIGRTTDNKNVTFKDNLTKSLTHLRDILDNIEGKIEHETKMLSQINYDLNRKHPAAGRIEYDQPTDILWKWENTVAPAEETTELTTMLTTQTPFMQDLKKTFKEYNNNYFAAFLVKSFLLVGTKTPIETMPVINIMKSETYKELDKGTFDNLGEDLLNTLKAFLRMSSNILPSIIKEEALGLYFILKKNDTVLTRWYRNMIGGYGKKFTEADGDKLFEALEDFNDYPNGEKTAADVGNLMVQAVLAPHKRQIAGTVRNTTEFAVNVMKPPAHRRSMDYEKHVKHFLLKHSPNLLDKIKKQYKNYKKNKHHHLSHKQKLDDYRRSRDGQWNKRDETRQRAHNISLQKDYNHSEYFEDTIENDMLRKIRESSSYSNEEDYLKNNLYNALRYGNRTLVI